VPIRAQLTIVEVSAPSERRCAEVVMPITKLQRFLDEHNVLYTRISHSLAYTSQGIAALAHIPGKELAKTVVIKIDGKMAIAVLPASAHIDLVRMKAAVGANAVELATEAEFKDKFPDCETGAMPPFGNLYDLPVLVDDSLTRNKEMVFNACSHRELIRMPYADFESLVKPTVLSFVRVKAVASAA
jgi:Ala-tRNA(Pro) deacylase